MFNFFFFVSIRFLFVFVFVLANLEVKRLGLSTHGTDARPIHSQICQRDYKKRKNFLDTSCESDKQWNWGMSPVAFPQLYIAKRKYSPNKAPDCRYSEIVQGKGKYSRKVSYKAHRPIYSQNMIRISRKRSGAEW